MRRTQSRTRTHRKRRSVALLTAPAPAHVHVHVAPPRPRRPLIPATAVAIFAILKSKTGAFPLSTVILEQYRPPLGKHVIGMPSPSPSLERTHTLVVLGQSFRPVRPLSPLSSDLSRTDSA